MKYISKEFRNQGITFIIDGEPLNLPSKYFDEKGRKKTTSISIKYDLQSKKEKDIVIEGTVIECRPNSEDDRKPQSTGYSILIGIPLSTIDWMVEEIVNEAFFRIKKNITYSFQCDNQDHVWLEFQTISEFTGNKEVHCQIYRKDLKKFETKGTLIETCTKLKSNIEGFGQFSVYLTKDDDLDFYLTGFQLVDVTNVRSYSQPEIEISPPDHVVEALSKSNGS